MITVMRGFVALPNVSLNADISSLSLSADIHILLALGDIGVIMHIRTPLDLGLTIRDRRRKLKLSQAELAREGGSRTTMGRGHGARQAPCRAWSGSPHP